MAGITGLGTTYNLPNYTGLLHLLSRAETPFFSAIGGLSASGGQTTETAFEWETYDLREAAQPAGIVEGADAPTAQSRARTNVSNVVQIHQEAVSVSYSKLAAVGQKSGVNNEQRNPIRSELDWQVEVMLKQMVRDVEVSFLTGTYQAPANNSTGRKTRGLLTASTTNAMDVTGAALPTVTATATTDLVNSTSHGLVVGDSVIFTALTGGAGLAIQTPYYVVWKDANTFKVSGVKGGTPIDITTDASAATAYKLTALTVGNVEDILQRIYDAGGMDETSTVVTNSSQKRALSAVYGAAYAKASPVQGTVGGVAVTQLDTDFGRLNIMLDPFMPRHKLAVAQLSQCRPVYLEVPGKGHFFAEPLAKTGAAEKVQLYGEVGLDYGNEMAHGVITGLAL